MIKLLLHESKRRVGSPGVFITPGTYFISTLAKIQDMKGNQISSLLTVPSKCLYRVRRLSTYINREIVLVIARLDKRLSCVCQYYVLCS